MTPEQVVVELNSDFITKGMSSTELTTIVTAWQECVMSRDTMLDPFRRREIPPEGRSDAEETMLIRREMANEPPNPLAGRAKAAD